MSCFVEGSPRGRDMGAAACLPQLVEAQAARAPGATAVVLGDRGLTYGELNAKANRLARHLRDRGVKLDTLVALCLERSFEMVVALLAVLKAGGAYVPLDAAYPAERLAWLLEDTGAPLVLTTSSLQERLPAQGVEVLCLDRCAEVLGEYSSPLDGGDARPGKAGGALAGAGAAAVPARTGRRRSRRRGVAPGGRKGGCT